MSKWNLDEHTCLIIDEAITDTKDSMKLINEEFDLNSEYLKSE